MLKQLQNKFQKVQKMSFLARKMVKMALSDGQNLTLNFDFRCHVSTFQEKKTRYLDFLKVGLDCSEVV